MQSSRNLHVKFCLYNNNVLTLTGNYTDAHSCGLRLVELRSHALQSQSSNSSSQIAFLLQLFLCDAPASWSTSASGLQACGIASKRLRGHRKMRSAFTGLGRFAVISKLSRMVYICNAETVVDESLVLKSVFTESALVWPRPQQPKDHHCWHAALVLAHNALANGASSSCERIGSLLHSMHSDCMPSARTVHRLRLREAKVLGVGSHEDETLLDELASVFLSAGKNPCLTADGVLKRRRVALPATGQLYSSASASTGDRCHTSEPAKEVAQQMLKTTAVGHALPDSDRSKYKVSVPVAEYLQGATAKHGGRHGQERIEILPVQPYVLRGRGAKQAGARSVQRQRLANWLDSEEGQDWVKEKERLWQGFMEDMNPARL